MEVKFYLKDPQKKGDTPIYARISNTFYSLNELGQRKYTQLKIYIDKKINPNYWNAETCRAREKLKKFPQYPEFNDYLNDIVTNLGRLHSVLRKEKVYITPELFKTRYEAEYKPQPKPTTQNFIDFAEAFIKTVKSIRKEGTIKSYQNSLSHLKNFASSKKISLSFENITLDFFLDLVEYLKTEKNFSPNTIWRIKKDLKMFLAEASERKLHTNTDYKGKRFTVKPIQTDAIYLNENELTKIYNVDFSNEKRYERVRDLFLIASFTGLRFSDFSKLRPDSIIQHEGKTMLQIHTQKTAQTVYIPIRPIVLELIQKYKDLKVTMSNQKFNEYIKEVVKKAEIKELITVETIQGNLKASETFEKWQLVTTHTARRSFSTNAYLAEVPTISIMKITGHKTEQAFLKYIKMSGKENARSMAEHKFFKTPTLKVAK